ncbi:MAG TPA: alpha/beta hydrolase-fold protein [Gemmatimonadales bacterium]|nr:alpha/beta hydrolase-fold protein [Gemmatimonadales bacterium]
MRLPLVTVLLAASLVPPTLAAQRAAVRFEVTIPASLRAEPATGRVYVFITRRNEVEPRLQMHGESNVPPFFGVDVTNLTADSPATIDGTTLGYPIESLAQLPPGDYFVQALLSVYSEFKRADGHTLWMHDDQWEGQDFLTSPGNLVSDARKVHIDPAAADTIRIALARAIAPITPPPDTKWVKRVKIQSPMLTKFWGRPIYLGATVLLPRDYDRDTTQQYPTVYEQGHFSLQPPFGFSTDSMTETPAQRTERLARSAREPGFEFFQSWRSDKFPRMIAVTFQHPTPYFDDSYAVNSVNNGPYGDAILTELIPYLESHFRMIRAPWARLLTGGSTGGWEAMALQVYHPDFFGGTWVLYPDPVDFRSYELVNIYSDSNAFVWPVSEWFSYDVPAEQEVTGQPRITVRQESQFEAVLGSHGRSGEQFAIWEATFGPVGKDGYTAELWDLRTGKVDHEVSDYFKAHDYDLRDYLERNWATLGPKLRGKITVWVGDMDTFYLNYAVYRLEEFLNRASPPADAHFEFGRPMKPHGWQPISNAAMIRQMAAYIANHRPNPKH